MWTFVAIEGIDRIGKSTFIDELKKKLQELNSKQRVSIEKPTIGINTLKKMGYPLQDIPNIMEIRNIGLFEETLFQAQQRQYEDNEIIIRDRFNLSELAYGIAYRPKMFKQTFNVEYPQRLYRKWNNWFETELQKCARVFMITFVLDRESYPNEDEAISAKDLVLVNEHFRLEHNLSAFNNKLLIELHKDSKTGITNIMDKFDEIMTFLTNYKWVGQEGAYFRRLDACKEPSEFIIQLGDSPILLGKETENGHILVGDTEIPIHDVYRIVEEHKDAIKSISGKYKDYQETKREIISFVSHIAISDLDSKRNDLPFPEPNESDELPF